MINTANQFPPLAVSRCAVLALRETLSVGAGS